MSDSILEKLYYGEIAPWETFYPDSPEYVRLKAELEEKRMGLSERLDEDGMQLLDEILELRVQMDSVDDSNRFISGFKTGVQLMINCLIDK